MTDKKQRSSFVLLLAIFVVVIATLMVLATVPMVECDCLARWAKFEEVSRYLNSSFVGISPTEPMPFCSACNDTGKVPLLRFSSGSQDPDRVE